MFHCLQDVAAVVAHSFFVATFDADSRKLPPPQGPPLQKIVGQAAEFVSDDGIVCGELSKYLRVRFTMTWPCATPHLVGLRACSSHEEQEGSLCLENPIPLGVFDPFRLSRRLCGPGSHAIRGSHV